MWYVWIAILAYLLFAINALIDKILLKGNRIGNPVVYAFAIGVLSLVVIVLIPWGFVWPGYETMLLSLFAGSLFTFALLLFFGALKTGETSRVVPVQGGFVPFLTLILAYVFLGDTLQIKGYFAFGLLLVGAFLISWEIRQRKKFNLPQLLLALLAALLFAMSFTFTKQVYNETNFINGLIWTRFGMALGAAFLLWPRDYRRAILEAKRKKTKKNIGIWFIVGQGIGAAAGLMQNWAISQGSVVMVNALQGTQFAFVFGLAALLSFKYPRLLREELSSSTLVLKTLAIALISAGIVVLVL